MRLSKEKIELLKNKLPELYELVLNVTSVLEGDLSYLKKLSKDAVQKLEQNDPSMLNTDLKLAAIKTKASAIRDRLIQSIKDCKSSLELTSNTSLADVLLSKEFEEAITFDERFIASAVATAITKIKY